MPINFFKKKPSEPPSKDAKIDPDAPAPNTASLETVVTSLPLQPLPLPRPRSLIIFDFDGTVGDNLSHLLHVLTQFSNQYSLNRTFSSYKDVLSLSEISIKNLALASKKYELIYGGMERLAENVKDVGLFPGMRKAIKYMHEKGVVLGIVTVSLKQSVIDFLSHHGLSQYFSFIESAAMPEVKKDPDKTELLKQVVKTHGDTGSSVYYVSARTNYAKAVTSPEINATPVAALWGKFDDEDAFKKSDVKHRLKSVEELCELVVPKKDIKAEVSLPLQVPVVASPPAPDAASAPRP